MRNTTLLAIGATIVALVLSACGGSSSSPSSTTAPATSSTAATSSAPPSSGQPASSLTIAADPSGQLKFTKRTLAAKAGKVTIQFTNNAQLAHNLTIASRGGAVLGATPTFQGGTKTLTLNLKAGTYTFYCSVPGHRDGGMKGTLTVR